MTKIPNTVKETLDGPTLAALEAALAPPMELRAKTRFEIEIEAVGEGTFTLLVDQGVVTAKKGFAKDPLLSTVVPKGSWPFVQRLLQEAIDGFPNAPAIKKNLELAKRPKPGEIDASIAAFKKLSDACVTFQIEGVGAFPIARGPVDEATRNLTIVVDKAAVESALNGGALSSVKPHIKGDRGLIAVITAALGPAIQRSRG